MSAEVSDEVEQVAAELPQEPLAETASDEKVLEGLITEWKAGGKDDTLQKAIASVKKGLSDKTTSISVLMDSDDFVPMLISGLQAETVEVQLDVMSIVDLILKNGGHPKVEVIVKSGMIPALITLLTSEDDAICQRTLQILRVFAFDEKTYSSLEHFRNSEIIPALIKVAERTENIEWLTSISIIAQHFCRRSGINLDEPVGKVGQPEPEMLPSLSDVREVLQLLKLLLRWKNEMMIGISICMAFASIYQVEGGVEAIISSGLLPSVLELLGDPEDLVSFMATFVVTEVSIYGKSDEQLLQFFQALRGSSAITQFYRSILKTDEEPEAGGEHAHQKLTSHVTEFLGRVRKAAERETLQPAFSEAVIESGFVFTLVKCLQMEGPLEPQIFAMSIIHSIVMGVDLAKLQPILDAGLISLLVEQLKNPDDRGPILALLCLTDLVKRKPSLREEVVGVNGHRQMIGMLHVSIQDAMLVTGVVAFFIQMFEQKPRLDVEVYKGLAEGLKLVLEREDRYKEEMPELANRLVIGVFMCVNGIAAYHQSGIELMIQSGIYEVLIEGLSLGKGERERQVDTLQMVVFAAMMKQEYRDVLIQVGLLECFPKLLENPSEEMRKLVLFCMKVFLDGELSPGQTKTIVEMKPLVEAEMAKGLPETLQAASVLLSNIEESEKTLEK